MSWKCFDCKQETELTRHSKNGGHTKPFIMLCKSCHNSRHNITESKTKYNLKFQRGTRKTKRKGGRQI